MISDDRDWTDWAGRLIMRSMRHLQMITHVGVAAALLVLSTACASAHSAARPDPATAISSFVSAMENADADALAGVFTEDATAFMPFDAVPKRLEGREEIRATFARFFAGVRKPGTKPPYMKLNPLDVQTAPVSDDVAIVTFHLGRVPDATSGPTSLARRTFVLHYRDGRWLVKHLHASNIRIEPPKQPE